MYIYPRIRDLREDKDLTQAEIANMLGTGITTYRRWEVGEREIPFHIILELAKIYNVSIDYIAGLSKDPIPKWNNDHANKNVNINQGNNNINNIKIK